MRSKKLLTLLLVALLLLLVGCGKKEQPQPEEKLVPVEVAAVQKGDLTQDLTVTGEIEAGTEVNILPKISGRVAAVHVQAGQLVSAGTVLLELEGTQARNNLLSSQAAVEMQRANLEAAQKSYDRTKRLLEEGAVSQVQFEQVETQLKLAQAQYNQAVAGLEIAQDNYQEVLVTSPISGKVAYIDAEVGELVGMQSPVAGVVDLSTAVVKVNISENVVKTLTVGQQVDVQINALNKTVPGQIKSIAPKIDTRTKAFPVEIQIANPNGEILAGMVAKITLATGQVKDALIIPAKAVLDHNGNKKVYVVENGVAREREVKIGISSRDSVEIIEGLKENEKVIVSGNRLVGEGQKVKIVNDGTAGSEK